jgi:hypothetical protein
VFEPSSGFLDNSLFSTNADSNQESVRLKGSEHALKATSCAISTSAEDGEDNQHCLESVNVEVLLKFARPIVEISREFLRDHRSDRTPKTR